jgi:hypothetical protein
MMSIFREWPEGAYLVAAVASHENLDGPGTCDLAAPPFEVRRVSPVISNFLHFWREACPVQGPCP